LVINKLEPVTHVTLPSAWAGAAVDEDLVIGTGVVRPGNMNNIQLEMLYVA